MPTPWRVRLSAFKKLKPPSEAEKEVERKFFIRKAVCERAREIRIRVSDNLANGCSCGLSGGVAVGGILKRRGGILSPLFTLRKSLRSQHFVSIGVAGKGCSVKNAGRGSFNKKCGRARTAYESNGGGAQLCYFISVAAIDEGEVPIEFVGFRRSCAKRYFQPLVFHLTYIVDNA